MGVSNGIYGSGLFKCEPSILAHILNFVLKNDNYVNFPVAYAYFLKKLGIEEDDTRKWYMQLRRLVERLESEGIVKVEKRDGLLWVSVTPKGVVLIQSLSKTQTNVRIHWARSEARRIVVTKWELLPEDWALLGDYFDFWDEDTSKRVLVFRDPETNEFFVVPYNHRFTEAGRGKALAKYNAIWDYASERFKYAVFTTLTIDPKRYSSIMDMAKGISKALNRFMSFLRRRLGFRPPYLSVLEWTDKGRPHLHVVLFGVKSIGDHFELTSYLERHGFGMVHWEYLIVNRNGRWVWARGRPPRAAPNSDARSYLRKYLLKALFGAARAARCDSCDGAVGYLQPAAKLSLYWATNKRFYTYSYRFFRAVTARFSRPRYDPPRYEFVGSFYILDLPDYILENLINPKVLELLG